MEYLICWNFLDNIIYLFLSQGSFYYYFLLKFKKSSDFVFGKYHREDYVSQNAVQRPSTIFGITKSSGELLCDYYNQKFGVDTRGLRLPGVISPDHRTVSSLYDYGSQVFFQAVKNKKFICNIKSDQKLPFIYVYDAADAAI